jgi:Asp-tRNA(Asn)/Glu-tRNA(Gln) amidotransferase A subunit family amidase
MRRQSLILGILKTSCLTEIFFETGLQRAKELDSYLSMHNKTMGPLHGLPISLKVCIPAQRPSIAWVHKLLGVG